MIKHNIKGLYCFIDDIRNCKCREEEEKKVLQEIIKIKKKFNEKNITNYKRKKYIWKLIYCHILGYGISLSYLDIIKLISSNNFSDKYCGYTALSLLINENNEMLNMMVSTVKLDIKNNDEKVNFLALHFASQKINGLIVENLYDDIFHIVTSNYIYKPNIRKKAFLCLANIYKKRHDLLLDSKNDLEIFKFLDQNLNEINMFNVFAYLNLIYVIILVFQKYESLYYYRKKEEKKKSMNDESDDLFNKDDLKIESNNSSNSSSKRFSLNIKDDLKKKYKSTSLLNEQNFVYNDLKKVDKILEIESECSFNYEEVNYYEIKKYINKYIHYILNVLYLILDDNLKIDEGFYYSQFRYPFLLIKCLQMIQLYDIHNLSQTTINNINDILYKIISKPYKKLQGKINDDFNVHLRKQNSSSINYNVSGSKNIFRKSFTKNNFYLNNKKGKEEFRNEKSAIYIEYGIIYECSNLYNFLDDKIEDRNRDIIICLITTSFDTKKSNINYVILNSLSKLKMNLKIYKMLEAHVMHLVNLLNNDDITIKLQTFNILFNMCNHNNWKLLINVFLHHLPYIDPYIQNEIIIKISILAENFSPDLTWYFDVIYKMIEITHKYIFQEVWFRLVQIITGFVQNEKNFKSFKREISGDSSSCAANSSGNNKSGNNKSGNSNSNSISNNNNNINSNINDINGTSGSNSNIGSSPSSGKNKGEQKVQIYAAMKCYKYLSDNFIKIELLIHLCSYIIGSFGYLIKDKIPMKDQLKILEKYFAFGSSHTKCVILMAMMKMVFYDNTLMLNIKKILNSCINHPDLELQTRACEFLNLCNLNNVSMFNYLLKNMPLYNVKKVHENFLIKRLLEKNKHTVIDFNEKENFLKFEKQHRDRNNRAWKYEKNYKDNEEDDNDNESASDDYSNNKFSYDSSEENYNKKKVRKGSNASSYNSKKSSSISSHNSKYSSENTDDNEKLFKILCLQKANNINDLWFNACLLDKSLFFKNNIISILVKQKYQENKAVLNFYIKNISKAVVNLSSINIEDCEQMSIKEQKSANNEKIDSHSVYIYKIIITISDIFYNIPSIYFNIITPMSSNASFSVKLPILITRFIRENKMNEATFKIYWKALTQVHNEDIIMGVPKFSKKYFLNYLINAFNFYILKIGSMLCASGYIHFPVTNNENKILILVKIRHEVKGCQISVVSSIKHLNNYLNKIFEIYLIKNK
ncbi:AP-2 complex subunit alpha [Plasmodium brasilianum]|uniref:AP-2 complex subunit alpha, putative n=2 Tax=Plasmodium (Plasmodium) TaxID=418103 RepID=A0A1A8W6D8_PLAMA|nr:AP-2 complex subunit alpha, putative [Plasmodium malariae]KAI4837325.1 AP-2 complex subunit alpha [Plasmodium brasilianum]SBS87241.1 AP-2 complex subunit alpha, putative [Plasmodium malariae]SCO93208.1 AP-2 complex subunit alpha, putative [Plasmodium malariae]